MEQHNAANHKKAIRFVAIIIPVIVVLIVICFLIYQLPINVNFLRGLH